MQMNVQLVVLMVNMTVVPMVVHMVSASMAHGHVMEWLTAMMAQMKPIVVVVQHVPMVNMIVVPMVVHMVSVSMDHGHVTVMQIAMMAQMKLTVVVLHQMQQCYL
jgi:hypothetical protein